MSFTAGSGRFWTDFCDFIAKKILLYVITNFLIFSTIYALFLVFVFIILFLKLFFFFFEGSPLPGFFFGFEICSVNHFFQFVPPSD